MVIHLKRILIFSDTHRDIKKASNILNNIPADLVIHLGDMISDVKDLKNTFPLIEFISISGNNDLSIMEKELVIEKFGLKFFLTHGHLRNLNSITYKAMEENCDYALFGHTHKSYVEKVGNLTLLNPGSISRPRDNFYSYGVIEIESQKHSCAIIKEEY